MNNENLGKEYYLQSRTEEFNELRNEVSRKMEDLSNDENVKKYIELMEKRNLIDKELESCSRQITTLHKEDCKNQEHPVVLFLGVDRDEYEGRAYYEGYCLNCEQHLTYPKGNMECYRMLDLKDGITNIFEIMETATKEYRLFRDCYYKYPRVLKDTEHSNRIIYKAMKKRHEAK